MWMAYFIPYQRQKVNPHPGVAVIRFVYMQKVVPARAQLLEQARTNSDI